MAVLTTAATTSILAIPIKDIYSLGKEQFSTALSKWNNSRAITALANKVAAYEKVKTIWQRDKDVKL